MADTFFFDSNAGSLRVCVQHFVNIKKKKSVAAPEKYFLGGRGIEGAKCGGGE